MRHTNYWVTKAVKMQIWLCLETKLMAPKLKSGSLHVLPPTAQWSSWRESFLYIWSFNLKVAHSFNHKQIDGSSKWKITKKWCSSPALFYSIVPKYSVWWPLRGQLDDNFSWTLDGTNLLKSSLDLLTLWPFDQNQKKDEKSLELVVRFKCRTDPFFDRLRLLSYNSWVI